MKNLRKFINGLSKVERTRFFEACDTTEGYLRKACSIGQKLGSDLCILIDRESGGAVPCESLRPDIDWAYLRDGQATSAVLDGYVTREEILQLPPPQEKATS